MIMMLLIVFFNPKSISVKPFKVVKINIGIAFEMIGKYYGQPVSEKPGFILLGGMIDPSYRGYIIVALINVIDKTIFYGEKIS